MYVCLVDPDRFLDSTFGHPAREPGNRWAFWYYKPAPLPRTLALDTRTVLALSEADSALGHLQGLGHLLVGEFREEGQAQRAALLGG